MLPLRLSRAGTLMVVCTMYACIYSVAVLAPFASLLFQSQKVINNKNPKQCADITFRNSVSPPSCSNNTGVRTTKNPTPFQNANQTNPSGSPSSSAPGGSSPSASATSSPSASSTAKSEAGQTVVGQWSLLLAAAI